MPDGNTTSPHAYRALGFVNNPFPPIDESASSPLWARVVTHAASNRLFAGCVRASLRARPVLITMKNDVPDYYLRLALNEFLSTTAGDPDLSMLTINASLEIMRIGRIRGALAELAERVAAANLPLTAGLYLADLLKDPDLTLPEAAALADGQVTDAAGAFASDPAAAFLRFLGARKTDALPTRDEEFDALHMTYLRGVGLEPEPAEEDAGPVVSEELDDRAPSVADAAPADDMSAEAMDPDDAMREYLLALVHEDLSPIISRALAGYRGFGESMVAQEMKVTKAPRKTLKAILRLMSYRWKLIVFLWENVESWPLMEHQAHLDVLAALSELRWTFGEFGVMGVTVVEGVAPELEEAFAGAEQVDWSVPGFQGLYEGDTSWNGELVGSWLDSAAVEGSSPVRLDGPELAPIVAAAEGDMLRFAVMAEVAFRDAAGRGATTLDADAVAAGLDSVKIEDGA